eukprot:850903-Pyramimonas_sp.AAC.1
MSAFTNERPASSGHTATLHRPRPLAAKISNSRSRLHAASASARAIPPFCRAWVTQGTRRAPGHLGRAVLGVVERHPGPPRWDSNGRSSTMLEQIHGMWGRSSARANRGWHLAQLRPQFEPRSPIPP